MGWKLNVPANSYYLLPIRNFIKNCNVSQRFLQMDGEIKPSYFEIILLITPIRVILTFSAIHSRMVYRIYWNQALSLEHMQQQSHTGQRPVTCALQR
jgi:hypothetical protein